jgi:vesicle coat complex subunit
MLLEVFFETIDDDTAPVQLALLTAVVKLFIKQPTEGEQLLPLILEWATETCGDPDIRDRLNYSFLNFRRVYLLAALVF